MVSDFRLGKNHKVFKNRKGRWERQNRYFHNSVADSLDTIAMSYKENNEIKLKIRKAYVICFIVIVVTGNSFVWTNLAKPTFILFDFLVLFYLCVILLFSGPNNSWNGNQRINKSIAIVKM